MEAWLDVVVSLMERLSGEFKELKESFKELKGENAILRKEILGIGASAASSGEKGMGLMEKTTLRELVEQIQFDVKALNAKVERSFHEEEYSGNTNKSSGEKRGQQDLPSSAEGVDYTEELVERFPVLEVKRKTLGEQKKWIKETFTECVKQTSVSEGASFGGRTLQTISSSIVPNPTDRSTSCTIKLSNHLSYALTDPRFHCWYGSKTSGPSKVDPHVSEVFTFRGQTDPGWCQFMCSFGTSSSLRLTIYSFTICNGNIQFRMAFTPQDVPTDENLYFKLWVISSAPDVWMHPPVDKVPIEGIIYDRKLLARGYMNPGRFSVLEIDIMAVSDESLPVDAKMKPLKDGESIGATLTYRNLVRGSNLDKVACIIEIGNCLNCTLRNRSGFFCNSARNNFLPSEILPFFQERFLASDDTNVEGMFSYEIESTDLCLLVALRAESGNNSFAVAFAQVPVLSNRNEFVVQMDPDAWKTHQYKKYAQANEGEQVIQIRNIRAIVKMTEDAESLLRIRIFAV